MGVTTIGYIVHFRPLVLGVLLKFDPCADLIFCSSVEWVHQAIDWITSIAIWRRVTRVDKHPYRTRRVRTLEYLAVWDRSK